MATALPGCGRQGGLVGMEYETWFTCISPYGAPTLENVPREADRQSAQLSGSAPALSLRQTDLAIALAKATTAQACRPVNGWVGREATPLLGTYRSSNPAVIRQHAAWLGGAGVDFLLIDWSNNLGNNWQNGVALGIMAATYNLAHTYTSIPHHPRLALLLGLDQGKVTPRLQQQVDLLYDLLLRNPRLRTLYQEFLGKPLLGVFTGPRFVPPPTWDDKRFTVRWVNGFNETTHGNRYGYWSWIDRVPQVTYRGQAGKQGTVRTAEAVTVAAGYPGTGAPAGWLAADAGPRRHGATYVKQWRTAFRVRPEVVLLCQWNEFAQPDQYDVERSNDMEPTALDGHGVHGNGGWGHYYLDLTATMVHAFKAGRPQPHPVLNPARP